MNILFSINKNFIEHLINTVYSICNYDNDLSIFVFYYDLQDIDIMYIKNILNSKVSSIDFVKIDSKFFEDMPLTNGKCQYFGMEMYSRLICQYFLPFKISKILFLDVDIIVNGSLKNLYNTSLDDKYYACCEDVAVDLVDISNRLHYECNKYYNSGVLLINLELLRSECMELNLFIKSIHKYKDLLIYPDQDLLNLLFYDYICCIDSKYNFLVKDSNIIKIDNPVLVHFAGIAKPWLINCGRYPFKYYASYYDLLLERRQIFKFIYLFIGHFIYKICYSIYKLIKK